MTALAQIETAARELNGWLLLGAVEVDPGGFSTVPNGIVLIERESSPLGEGREYATARYNVHPSGVGFESGNYDLTREGALTDFLRRAREI